MRIRLYSDIHLEFLADKWKKKGDDGIGKLHDDVDVLVLAGDVGTGDYFTSYIDFLLIRNPNLKIVAVAGNHDYWDYSIESRIEYLKQFSADRKNFYFLERSSIVIDGVKFIGGTLWTSYYDGNYSEMFLASRCMNDFRKINVCTPNTLYDYHKKTVEYIFNNLDDNSVVVTHHKPYLSSSEDLSGAYESNIRELEQKRPKLWLYGHTHNFDDHMLYEDMRVVSNPRGYFGYRTCKYFNKDMIIEI